MRRLLMPIAAAALAGFAMSAAADQIGTPNTAPAGQPTTQEQGMTDNGTKVPPPTPSTKAYRAAVPQVLKRMAIQYNGDADKDFATILTAHNQGASDLVKVELEHGTDPAMRKLAQDIIDAREKELALIRAWQAKHP